jgi:hypothetical protein
MTEERVTEFVPVSAGDSRGLRTCGRIDRTRSIYRYLDAKRTYELISTDLIHAGLAAAQRGVVLPIALCISAMLPKKMTRRDSFLRSGASSRFRVALSAAKNLLCHPRKRVRTQNACRQRES